MARNTGSRCYVRLDILRQFKSELVRRLEGLVFVKKSNIIERERESESERERERQRERDRERETERDRERETERERENLT